VERGLIVVMAVAGVGCGEARPPEDPRVPAVTWRDDLAAPLAARCGGCHGGAAPAAKYDLTSYLGALGAGSDAVANAIAGNPESVLVTAIDPAHADPIHAPMADLAPLVRSWVVDSQLAYFRSLFHPGGILDPAQTDQFHGDLVQQLGFRLDTCAGCHGADFAGGKSGASCTTCHAGGPTACTTCHGQPPPTGSHLAHLAGTGARAVACTDCHEVPAAWSDIGHLFASDGSVITEARVTFGAQANAGATRSGPASYDRASGRCSGVYCHGATLGDPAANETAPAWGGSAPCGSCHGAPPASHQNARCPLCHSTIARDAATISDPARHVDGTVQVGDGSGTCTACHDVANEPAAIGAHRVHLTQPHGLRAPLACTDCHRLPQQLHDPGHIDHDLPAIVFPDGTSALARSGGAKPSFDAASATCSDVWCHGGGGLASDLSANVVRTPSWTGPPVICGACHGIPPVDASHTPLMTLGQCADCHAASIDAKGTLLSHHLDGVVDAP
jgi:predicted CxxxxCH...CXXCH cytochrome family protein